MIFNSAEAKAQHTQPSSKVSQRTANVYELIMNEDTCLYVIIAQSYRQ